MISLDKPYIAIALLGVTAGALCLNFWGWDLWAPDEPRYAEVAREMISDGNWVVPHLGGKVYSEKPPLFFWMISSSYKIFGTGPFAVRIVAALSSLGTLIITYMLGRKLFESRAGLLAAMVLGTSLLFMHLSRRGNIDATLTLLITAAMALIAKGYFENRPRFYYPAYLIMGLGVILKGPVALLLPVSIFIIYMVVLKDTKGIRKAHLVCGLGIVLLIVAAWLVPATIVGGWSYFKTVVVKQNLGRAIGAFSHKAPFYYYIGQLPWLFFPWIVFLPQTLYFILRSRTREELFPLVWFATVFVFFSFMSGKRGLYLLPLFPAAALMVGYWFNDVLKSTISSRSLTAAVIVLGAALLAAATALWLVKIPDYAFGLRKFRLPLSLLLVSGAAALGFVVSTRRHKAVFSIIFILMAAVNVFTAYCIFPTANEFKSARFICEELLERRRPNEEVVLYRDMTRSGAYHFYTRLPLTEILDEKTLHKVLKSKEKQYILSSKKHYDDLAWKLRQKLRPLSQKQVGHRSMMLFVHGDKTNAP